MKKWIWIFLGVVLLTAAAIELTTQLVTPLVVDADDILNCFYETRSSLPPVPSPVDYKTVVTQLSEDRFDFMSNPYWGFTHSGGTLYLSDESELKLDLPMILTAYEDLASGQVVLSGTPVGSKKVQTLAIVDAPEFSELDERMTTDSWLLKEFWPRRIIWTAELRSEEDATLLSILEQTLLSTEDTQAEMSASLAMTTMSTSETITDFRLIQNETNRLFLSVNLPDEFAGSTLELYSRSNLVDGAWTNVLQTNAASSGVMELGEITLPDMPCEITITTNAETIYINPIDGTTNVIPAGVYTNYEYSSVTAFFKVTANSTIDTDADGLGNLWEYLLGTGYSDMDSDDDGLLDGEEVDSGQDPLTENGIPDEFETGMQSASNGVFVVLPERCWHAQESLLNLETYGAYGEE